MCVSRVTKIFQSSCLLFCAYSVLITLDLLSPLITNFSTASNLYIFHIILYLTVVYPPKLLIY